ncbi:hypothetical protein ACTXT7_016948 [Hymenolepis weldensis]
MDCQQQQTSKTQAHLSISIDDSKLKYVTVNEIDSSYNLKYTGRISVIGITSLSLSIEKLTLARLNQGGCPPININSVTSD